jgi:CelD/BcsL family acetyltransferase involved in cellulose biosynthesis
MRYGSFGRLSAQPGFAERDDYREAPPSQMSVEITTPERLETIGRAWQDLAGRAVAANAFMEPALIAAAADADTAEMVALLVWGPPREGEGSRLLGGWVLARRRASPLLPFDILKTPVHGHTFLGTPLLDRAAAFATLSAMLGAIANDPALPKVVHIESLDAAGPIAEIFAGVLAQRRLSSAVIETRQRPALAKADPAGAANPVSRNRAKDLRRRRKWLTQQGALSHTHHAELAEVRAAFEEFLVLEASGWKARRSARGQAILRSDAVTTFFRRAIAALAARGQVRITALRLDGRAIAAQVVLVSGDTVFGWKTAYDEAFRAGAPGLLLYEDLTTRLLDNRDIASGDSCSHDDTGPLADFWASRRRVCDMIVDVGARRSPGFALMHALEAGRLRLLTSARRVRSRLVAARRRSSSRIAASAGGER